MSLLGRSGLLHAGVPKLQSEKLSLDHYSQKATENSVILVTFPRKMWVNIYPTPREHTKETLLAWWASEFWGVTHRTQRKRHHRKPTPV